MTSKPEKLPDDPAVLRQFIEQLVTLVEKQGRDIERYKQTIEKLQRLQFGQKSEKLDPLQQLLGFATDETPAESTPVEPEPPAPQSTDSPSPKPKKKGHGRRRLPDDLKP